MTFFGLNLVLICYWAISTAGLLIWIATNKADLFENPKLDNPSPHDCPHLYYLVHLDKHSSLISRCIYSSNKTLWFWVQIEVPLFFGLSFPPSFWVKYEIPFVEKFISCFVSLPWPDNISGFRFYFLQKRSKWTEILHED